MEKEFITSHVIMAIIFALIAAALNYIAYLKGFFKLNVSTSKGPQVSIKQVVQVFIVYIFVSIIFTPFIIKCIQLLSSKQLSPISLMTIAQISIFFLSYALIIILSLQGDRKTIKLLWKDRSDGECPSIGYDFFFGVMTWLACFPMIIFINQAFELLIYFIFGSKGFPQVAVEYLQRALVSPYYFTVALVTVIIAAPILEEFLFRASLQSLFKKYFGAKSAILLSSLCFALFHFAPEQGISNFPLIFSLFIFALYLGFVYERQKSLFAPIALHVTFNAVSVARILLTSHGM